MATLRGRDDDNMGAQETAREENVMWAMEGTWDDSQCVLCAMADLGSLMSDRSDGQFWKCLVLDTLVCDRNRRLGKCINPSLSFCLQHASGQSLLLTFDLSYNYM